MPFKLYHAQTYILLIYYLLWKTKKNLKPGIRLAHNPHTQVHYHKELETGRELETWHSRREEEILVKTLGHILPVSEFKALRYILTLALITVLGVGINTYARHILTPCLSVRWRTITASVIAQSRPYAGILSSTR